MRNAEEYNEELLNLAQGLSLSDWDKCYTEFIKRVQTEAWNEAIELSIQKVGRDSFVKEQLLKLKKMRTPEEILTNVYGCLTWGETVRDFLTEVSPTIITDAIKIAQQEAYEEGRRDGYAACKGDYATQITYNK